MSQTAYNREQPDAFAGLKADAGFDRIESYLAEGAIDFGLGVVKGTDPERQVKVAALVTDEFAGYSIHQHVEKVLGSGVAQYKDKETAGVMRQGVVWCQVESTVAVPAIDAPVYINVVVGGAELGRVTEVSTGNIATGGTFKKISTDPDGNAIAAVEINLP